MHRMPNGSGELCDGRVACLRQQNGEERHHDHKDGIWQVALRERHALILRYRLERDDNDTNKQGNTLLILRDYRVVQRRRNNNAAGHRITVYDISTTANPLQAGA